MMEYKIVEENCIFETEKTVNVLIQKGWKPLGGISSILYVDNDGDWIQWYTQAMIREVTEGK